MQAPATLLNGGQSWVAMRIRLATSSAAAGSSLAGLFGWGDGSDGANAITVYRRPRLRWRD